MRSRSAITAAVLLGLLFIGPSGLALGPAPYPTGPVTFQAYKFDPATVKPGEKSVFKFTWNGIIAAEAVFSIASDPDRPGINCVRADAQTVGAAALLYRAKDWAASCMNAKTLKPESFTMQIRESLDYYDMNTCFDHNKDRAERIKKTLSKQTERSFEFTNAFCPMSTAVLIRSLPWKVGDERSFEVITGDERYLLVIKAVEEGEVTVPAGTFKAVRLEPSVFEMPYERERETRHYWERQEEKDRNRTADMTSFTLWMAADPPRQFLKARSDVYFGHVDMELAEFNSPP